MESNVDFSRLVPEIDQWSDGQGGMGVSIDSWVRLVGNYEHAIGYSRLFWPEFAEHDGCVLRAPVTISSYDGFFAQNGGNRQAVEEIMNHVHISDLFYVSPSPSIEQMLYLGRVLCDTWGAKLCRDFPDREFVVSLDEEECIITFNQK